MLRLPLVVAIALLATFGCGGGSITGPGPSSSLNLSLSSSTVQLFPGDAATSVNLTLARTGTTGSVSAQVSGAPAGVVIQTQPPGTGDTGAVSIAPGTASAGTYSLTVNVSDGTVSASAPLSLTIGALVQISPTVSGQLNLAMSTSFQPAEWDDQFFTAVPGSTGPLGDLLPQHIRLQPVSQGVPQTSASTWDFSVVDAITQPVLTIGDDSPEFQIAMGPSFIYDANGNFLDPTFQQLATYAQNLVRYYNTGGFTAPDGTHVSPNSTAHITWWGIYNEPNINNNLTASEYVQLYNTLVPAMQSVDPTLKFVALELADFSGQPQAFVPTFVNNVTAHVDVMATHFYSTCNQRDTDATVFQTVPGFATDVRYFYAQMATNPALASVPVWVTENNVNADYDKGGGLSACNPGQTFVTDQRGSSAFFAAWRPYVFSQLGQAGAEALYHWDYDADAQYGEVDYATGAKQLSYWVDYWLARMFPSPPGESILQFTNTDSSNLEALATRNADGSTTVMVADHAVKSTTDNNGPGAPRTVALDISSLGNYQSASLLTIDASTSVANGPTAVAVTPANRIVVTLNGYGVAFLHLQ
jgi:Glycosyl hydrolase catalytic core